MITFSNRKSAVHGELIAAYIDQTLIAFFDPGLHIVNVAETDVVNDGNATASLTDNRFDYLVRECLNVIRTRTNEQRPKPTPPPGPAPRGRAVGQGSPLT